MFKAYTGLFLGVALIATWGTNTSAQQNATELTTVISGTGRYIGPGLKHGMQSTMRCNSTSAIFVRGSAKLDSESATLSMEVGLESNLPTTGPKGNVTVTVKDAEGKTLATATSDEIGMAGTTNWHARDDNQQYLVVDSVVRSSASIDPEVAHRAKSLYVVAQCTGSSNSFSGVDDYGAFKIDVRLAGLSAMSKP
jgi:hypothetical protein